MKDTIVKVHTRDGREMYLNANYLVRYSDGVVVVDDWVYNSDCKIPESKHSYDVFETADEISGQIRGAVEWQALDQKYKEEFQAAAKNRSEDCPF